MASDLGGRFRPLYENNVFFPIAGSHAEATRDLLDDLLGICPGTYLELIRDPLVYVIFPMLAPRHIGPFWLHDLYEYRGRYYLEPPAIRTLPVRECDRYDGKILTYDVCGWDLTPQQYTIELSPDIIERSAAPTRWSPVFVLHGKETRCFMVHRDFVFPSRFG